MLGGYVDSSATVVPALWVPLDFCVVKCTLVLHSGTSCRVIPLFHGGCSADDISLLLVVVAGAFVNPNGMTKSFWNFVDPRNLCGSSRLGTLSFPVILFQRSPSQNRSSCRIPIGCLERCGARVAISFAAFVLIVLVSQCEVFRQCYPWLWDLGDHLLTVMWTVSRDAIW